MRRRLEDLYKPGTYCAAHGRRENWASHMAAYQQDHWRQHPECLAAAERAFRREELLEELLDKLEQEDDET